MPSPLPALDAARRAELFDDLSYLNVREYRSFCDAHGIPYRIAIETGAGPRASGDLDRKDVVIGRIRTYLRSGTIEPATCYAARVVRLGPLDRDPRSTDRLYYGRYDKKSAALMRLLRDLTGGRFENGAHARLILRDWWTRGEAPTIARFAKDWLAKCDSPLAVAEYAYLTDLQRDEAGKDWKAKRARKAAAVLAILETIRR